MVIFALVALALLILGPQVWIGLTLSRHGKARPDLAGTGGELALHLVERFGLDGVKVERTERGDHYDPASMAVRLSPAHFDGRSLAAVAVAAHEVGHALQHHDDERKFRLWRRLATLAATTDRLAVWFFIASPIIGGVARTPLAFAAVAGIGMALLGVRVIVNIVTLPVEYDASFGKALPILREGGYVEDRDMGPVRAVLRAAAFTYLAGALISLVNLARWARLLR